MYLTALAVDIMACKGKVFGLHMLAGIIKLRYINHTSSSLFRLFLTDAGNANLYNILFQTTFIVT